MSVTEQQTSETRLVDVLAAERMKVTSSRLWVYCLVFGTLLALLSVVGSATEGEELIRAGVPVSDVTSQSIRYWFMMLLASSIFGALFVTREYSNGSIVRSVLLSGQRRRLFLAKLIVSTCVGVVFALAALVLVAVSYWFVVPLSGEPAQWSDDATRTTIGVAVVIVAAAPWGTALGWLIRHQGVTVAVLLVLTLVVDEGLFRLAPDIGKYMLQINMSSLYLDDRADLLSVPVASVVMVTWIVAATVLAGVLLRRRDVP